MKGPVARVSVGMPVYNVEATVGEAIRSILEQSMPDLELVISDNASTDTTFDVCSRYAARDSRIRLVRNATNMGAAENYNRVFREARAPLFKWASGNDVCHPDFLQMSTDALDANPGAVLAYPRTVVFTGAVASGRRLEENLQLDVPDPCQRVVHFFERLRLNNVMNGVVRAEALRRTPLNGCYRGSDLPMVLALLLQGPFIEVPHYHFYRRMDAESATQLQSEEQVRRHFDPSGRRRMLFPSFRLHRAYFSCVWRSPLSGRQKLILTRQLARRVVWDRQHLMRESVRSCGRLLHLRGTRGG